MTYILDMPEMLSGLTGGVSLPFPLTLAELAPVPVPAPLAVPGAEGGGMAVLPFVPLDPPLLLGPRFWPDD